eukprot:gene18742-20631_t
MAESRDGSSLTGKENKQNIWTQILSEVSAQATRKLPQNKRVLILGDDGSGKTSLITKLRDPGEEHIRKGSGLEFTYLDVHDEERDEHARLNVWIMDGDFYHKELLKYVITPEMIRNVFIVIAVDMSKPWTIMDNLEQWIRLIREHLHTLKMSAKDLNDIEADLLNKFREYREPDEAEEEAKRSRSHAASATTSTTTTVEEDDVMLPLGETILSNNLGLPILVVTTKSDAMSTLEKENNYKDEHFDFIQKHIRNFCLRYGAALMYTSVKDGRNLDAFYKYLIHRIYDFPLRIPPQVVEKDAVFIPMGWDNDNKIAILDEQIKSFDPTDLFESQISKPILRKPASMDKEISAEDEQAFLAILENNLSKAPQTAAGIPRPQQELMRPRVSTSPGQRLGDKRTGIASATKTKMEGPKGAAAGQGEGVLANFFNSLLQKKTVSGGGAATVKAPQSNPTERAAVRSDVAAELERLSKKAQNQNIRSPTGS